jgi:hypothetical protein
VLAGLKQRDGLLAADAGDHVRAIALTDQAIREGDAAGVPIQPSVAIAWRAGDLQAVLRMAERGLRPISLAARAAVMLHRREAGFVELARSPTVHGATIDLLVLPQLFEAAGDRLRAMRTAERAERSPDHWMGTAADGSASICRLAFGLGDLDRARSEFERARGELENPVPWNRAAIAAWCGEALPAMLDRGALEKLADWAWETEAGTPRVIAGMFGSFDRVRAMWALALDRLGEAERLARRGLEWCERERCPVEAGRCHQLLADVLRRKGSTLEARAHLDAASALFQRHGARLYLDQVLEQRDLLKA